MMYTKRIALVLATAMALFAFLGGSSASATKLYKATDLAFDDALNAGTRLEASLTGSASLADTNGNSINTCTVSTVAGDITNGGSSSSTTTGHIDVLTWSSCTHTTTTLVNGNLEIHHIAGTSNGSVTGSGSVVTISVFGSSCLYGTGANTHFGEMVGTHDDEKHATLGILAVVKEEEPKKLLCPDSAVWKANYTFTTPTGLYVDAS
jgi:hypothetical protein